MFSTKALLLALSFSSIAASATAQEEAATAAAEEVSTCTALNITVYSCRNYCGDNGYDGITVPGSAWTIDSNGDKSCICMSTDFTTKTTVCTNPNMNPPVMAPAPVGPVPSCTSLSITDSEECIDKCYPEGSSSKTVSFNTPSDKVGAECKCGGDDDGFVLCSYDATAASPTNDADVVPCVLAGFFALFASIMHIM